MPGTHSQCICATLNYRWTASKLNWKLTLTPPGLHLSFNFVRRARYFISWRVQVSVLNWIELNGNRKHTDLALCERYMDAEQTHGKRTAGVCKTQLNADQTYTEPGSTLDTKTSYHSSRATSQCVNGLHLMASCEFLLACPVFAFTQSKVGVHYLSRLDDTYYTYFIICWKNVLIRVFYF